MGMWMKSRQWVSQCNECSELTHYGRHRRVRDARAEGTILAGYGKGKDPWCFRPDGTYVFQKGSGYPIGIN